MSQNPSSSDWSHARGDKWSASLARTEAMLSAVDAPLLAALQLTRPATIAEVGCGGGATAIELARRAPTGSVVHGYDISATLVGMARARLTPDDSAVAFDVADMAVARPQKPYERLVSRFGVMFFDEPRRAFANLAHWLEPDGRFAFAVWAAMADNPWFTVVRDVVGELVELPRVAADAPGPYRYAEVEGLLDILRDTGFADVEVHDWRGPLALGGGLAASAAASFALASFSSFAELLEAAGPPTRAEAQERLTTRFASHEHAGHVVLAARVHIVTGRH